MTVELDMENYMHAQVSPRIQLAPGDYVSAEMRERMNAWLLDFFGARTVESIAAPPIRSDRVVVQQIRTRKNRDERFSDFSSLLNCIDETFAKLERLKKSKVPMAKMLRKHGPYIVPNDWGHTYDDGDAVHIDHLESFSAFGCPSFLFLDMPWRKEGKDDSFNHFSMAVKFDKLPAQLKKPGFCYYEFGCYFPKRIDKIPEFGVAAYVGVHEQTGEVIAMPTLMSKSVNLKNGERVTHRGWRYAAIPNNADDWRTWSQSRNAEEIVKHFTLIYNMTMWREYGVNIVAKKDGSKATFIVPEHRWKDFFKDRFDVKAVDGRRKRIFHAVTAHSRSNGSNVRTHYKGSRHFFWRGYEISIVMPGKHGAAQASLNISAHNFGPEEVVPRKSIALEDLDVSRIFGHAA